MATELLAWDKARNAGYLGSPVDPDTARLIEQGAECYQRVLAVLHEEPGTYAPEEGEDWLRRSEAARSGRQYMTSRGGLLTRAKPNLTEEDYERLDRAHPERTFSGGRPERPLAEPPGPSQLERLATLHSEGVLTDEEYAAARRRLG